MVSRPPKEKCTVPGCEFDRRRAGEPYCGPHRGRVLRIGDVQADKPIRQWTPSRQAASGAAIADGPMQAERQRWWCTPCRQWVVNLVHVPAWVVRMQGGVS